MHLNKFLNKHSMHTLESKDKMKYWTA